MCMVMLRFFYIGGVQETLHHLGCLGSPVYNGISYLSTGAGFLLSTAHLLVTKAQAGFLIFAATAAVPPSLLDAISVV